MPRVAGDWTRRRACPSKRQCGLARAGAEDLLWQDSAEHPIAPLHALVERLRLPRANAWSLNVVFSQPRGIQRAGCAHAQPCCVLPRCQAVVHKEDPALGACPLSSVAAFFICLGRRSGPQDAHMDNLALTDSTGAHTCRLASYQTSVLYLSVPEVIPWSSLNMHGKFC